MYSSLYAVVWNNQRLKNCGRLRSLKKQGTKLGLLACDPNTREVQAWGSGVECHPQPHKKFQTYIVRP